MEEDKAEWAAVGDKEGWVATEGKAEAWAKGAEARGVAA
jgi:hypothetical protein